MTAGIGPGHDRAVRNERVVSTAINSLIPAGIIWALDLPPPSTLLGPTGIILPMSQAALAATFLMTLVLTAIVRARVGNGALPMLDWPRGDRGWYRRLPQNIVRRAAVLAVIAWLLLVPAGLLLVALLAILPMTRTTMLVFNLLFGAVIGIVMTRPVVLAALADGRPR